MVEGLLDSAIVIDVIRDYQPALDWFSAIDIEVGVSKFVWLEVVHGAQSKQRQRSVIQLLLSFSLVPIDMTDVDWALARLTATVLANSGIDPMDALIAATSHRLQLPLYTRNLKHMRPLLGDLAQQPY